MQPATELRYYPLWTPKAGNTIAEYEDAVWPTRVVATGAGPGASFRCAVADGASESTFAGEWARMLVRAHGRGELDDIESGRRHLAGRWESVARRRPLPWYAAEKVDRGAHAALVCLTITNGGEYGEASTWTATAVGDACLFAIRGGELALAFPLTSSAGFSLSPTLIGTSESESIATVVHRAQGELEPGDRLILATDALAAWFLASHERGEAVWPLLNRIPTGASDEFRELVGSLRSRGMRNDDVSVAVIDVLPSVHRA